MCAQATWAITNHASIGEYQLHFFLREEFVHTGYIQLKQDVISFITVDSSTRDGIQKEKLSSNLYLSWSLTQMLSSLEKVLYEMAI